MTIFLMVVKELIKKRLEEEIDRLKNQRGKVVGWFYSESLTNAQISILKTLESDLDLTKFTLNDKDNLTEVLDKITKARDALEEVRADKGKKENGGTVEGLNALLVSVQKFYDKMKGFMHKRDKKTDKIIANSDEGFSLLNRAFLLTPANQLYYEMTYFIGLDIVFPVEGNGNTRKEKEDLVRDELGRLNKLVMVNPSFENQAYEVTKTITNLTTYNKQIVERGSAASKPIKYLSYLDISYLNLGKLLAMVFKYSEGRLLILLDLATKRIKFIDSTNFNLQVKAPTTDQGVHVVSGSKKSASAVEKQHSTSSSPTISRRGSDAGTSEDRTPSPPPPDDDAGVQNNDDDGVQNNGDDVVIENHDEDPTSALAM